MEIHFRDKKLRELCERRAAAVKKLGDAGARKLRARLDDLESAGNVTELLAGSPHPLKGDRAGQFAVSLAGGWRLVFAPHHDPAPSHTDGSIDWRRVSIVCIETIEDYHD